MSTRVVMPPAAAARVAVAKPSHSVLPGSHMCTWESTRPGISTTSSSNLSSLAALSLTPGDSIASNRPSLTPMAHPASPSGRSTRGARMRRSTASLMVDGGAHGLWQLLDFRIAKDLRGIPAPRDQPDEYEVDDRAGGPGLDRRRTDVGNPESRCAGDEASRDSPDRGTRDERDDARPVADGQLV